MVVETAGRSSAVSRRIPQLDTLRGVAILLVLFDHGSDLCGSYPVLQKIRHCGWIGVELFFVLSGYLITRILIDTRSDRRFLRNFYARRILRIWPLYALLLIFVFGLFPILRPDSVLIRQDAIWHYVLMIQNFLPDCCHGLVMPTWSLAVEEQFYLVWPLVVLLAPTRSLKFIAALVLVLSPVMRWRHLVSGYDARLLYRIAWFHLDGLAAGSLVALTLRETWPDAGARRTVASIAACVGAAGGLVTWWLAPDKPDYARPLAYTFLALTFSGLTIHAIAAAALQKGKGVSRGVRFLRYSGEISYGLYLIHSITLYAAGSLNRFQAFAALPLRVREPFGVAIGMALAYGAAALSWRYVESPILALKSRFEYAGLRLPRNDPYRPDTT